MKVQGLVSRKSRKLFGPEKPFVKLRPAYSVKLVFSYVVKGIKIKITSKFRVSRRLCFEDTKRIVSPEKFRDFRETGPRTGYCSYHVFTCFQMAEGALDSQMKIQVVQLQYHIDHRILMDNCEWSKS